MFIYAGDSVAICFDLLNAVTAEPVLVDTIVEVWIQVGNQLYTIDSPEVDLTAESGNTIQLKLPPEKTKLLNAGQRVICKVRDIDGQVSTISNTLLSFKTHDLKDSY